MEDSGSFLVPLPTCASGFMTITTECIEAQPNKTHTHTQQDSMDPAFLKYTETG